MRTASLDRNLNISSQKIKGFLFCSFPVVGVALFTEIRHILILDILSQLVRAFFLFPVAGSFCSKHLKCLWSNEDCLA